MKKLLFVLLIWWLPYLCFAQQKVNPTLIPIGKTKKNHIIEVYSRQKPGTFHIPAHNPSIDTVVMIFEESIVLDIKTKYNVSLTVKDDFVKSILAVLKDVDTLKINDALKANIAVQNGNKHGWPGDLGVLEINKANVGSIDFQDGCIDAITLKECNAAIINLKNSIIPVTFDLYQVVLDSTSFHNTQLPHTFTLHSVDVPTVNKMVDFTCLRNIKNCAYGYYLERRLRIGDTDLDKFKLPYDRLNFHVDSADGITRKTWIYEKMLRNLSSLGLSDKYEYYKDQLNDVKDAHNHGWIRNTANELWWDNGHNRRKVIWNSVIIFGFFFFLNCIFFWQCYKALAGVYMPKAFKRYFLGIKEKYSNWWLHKFLHGSGIVFYTLSIFLGPWLDLKALTLKNVPLLVFVLVQYLAGLVCVAYIVGIFIVAW